jgi:hypothetical protein
MVLINWPSATIPPILRVAAHNYSEGPRSAAAEKADFGGSPATDISFVYRRSDVNISLRGMCEGLAWRNSFGRFGAASVHGGYLDTLSLLARRLTSA